MASGSVMPYPRIQFFDTSGSPLASGTLETYAAGTTTPLATYSDVGLSVSNPTTITLNSAGRPSVSGTEVAVFLAASTYKFVLKNSAGATIWTQDNIYASQPTTSVICEGRLTGTTATPVTTADVTNATSIYFTPYCGNRVALYDGTTWQVRTFTELTLSLTGFTASTPYDIFAYDNSGTVALETLIWTNATTRATALTTQDGVLVKTGATTRRYLGTIYINASGGQVSDRMAERHIWNYYNRVDRPMAVNEGTDSWTYTTATIRQANGATGNQLDFVIGWSEDAVSAQVYGVAQNSSAGVSFAVGVGLDSTTANASGARMVPAVSYTVDKKVGLHAQYQGFPGVGRHRLVWLEFSSATGATTWYGDDGGPTITQSGISGLVRG